MSIWFGLISLYRWYEQYLGMSSTVLFGRNWIVLDRVLLQEAIPNGSENNWQTADEREW